MLNTGNRLGEFMEILKSLFAFAFVAGIAVLLVYLVRRGLKIDAEEYKKHAAEQEAKASALAMSQRRKGPSAAETFFKGAVGLVFVLAGFAVLGLQAYWYLKFGAWTPMSLIDVARWVIADVAQPNEIQSWIMYPETWTGLHKILNWIPLSAVLIAFGYFVVVSE